MPDFSFLLRFFKNYFLPTSCPVCLKSTERIGVCNDCHRALEDARLLKNTYEFDVNGRNVKCRSVFSYESEQVKNIVFFIKNNPDAHVFKYLAAFVSREVRAFNLDGETLITYLPRSSEGMGLHGFDQSRMLAQAVSQIADSVKFMSLLKRCGRSKTQKRLSGKDRRENVKGKFRAVKTQASPKNIIITDDMFTTGSSVKECAAELIRAYPKAEIFCVTVAKNPEVTKYGGKTERI